MNRRRLLKAGLGTIAAAANATARAQSTTIRFIYPYAPGNGSDALIRVLADVVEQKLGVAAIVENRTGADGRVGVRDAKAAEPDGKTFLFTPFGTMVLFPTFYANLPYDPVADFAPVAQLTTVDFGLAAGPKTPAKNLSELATWLKQNPGEGTFGVPGIGAMPHFLPLRFASLIGAQLRPIAYRGALPAVTDAMAGHIPLVSAALSDLLAQHRAGTIRLLAVSGRERSAFAPEVPTFVEQGYDVQALGWYALYAPARTPAKAIDDVGRIVVDWLHSDPGRERCRQLWMNPTGTTPGELAAIQKADRDAWAPVIKASGYAPE